MSTYEMLEHSPTQAKDEEFVLRDLVRMIVDQIWWVLGIALGILLVAAPDAIPGLTIPGDPTMVHPHDMAPMPGMAIQN